MEAWRSVGGCCSWWGDGWEYLEHGFVDGNGLESRGGKVFVSVCLF